MFSDVFLQVDGRSVETNKGKHPSECLDASPNMSFLFIEREFLSTDRSL